MSDINNLVNEFNDVMIDFVENIATVCPQSIIADNLKYIRTIYKDIINNKNEDYPKECFITLFMKYVLPHQIEIRNGDDSYFLTDHCYKNIKNNDYMSKIFHFKDLWKSLKQENKDIVIDYMVILCDISQEYFNILDDCGAFD